jgi:hypothetical protein
MDWKAIKLIDGGSWKCVYNQKIATKSNSYPSHIQLSQIQNTKFAILIM